MEIIGGELDSIAKEMAHKLIRSAYSVIIRESEDMGCAILNTDCEEMAESDNTPLHVGSLIAYTKGALETLTIGLAKEVAEEGIRVNGVRPGHIYTSMHAAGGEPGRVREGLEDVGRVVELDDLGGALEDLRLAHPLAGLVVEVAASGAEGEVGRDREEVRVVVDQRQPADRVDPGGVVAEEAVQLLRRLDEEVGPLEGGLSRDLTQLVASGIHRFASDQGWNSRSGPIRSRRNIEWWRSNIHSPARCPSAREDSSASSLSIVP